MQSRTHAGRARGGVAAAYTRITSVAAAQTCRSIAPVRDGIYRQRELLIKHFRSDTDIHGALPLPAKRNSTLGANMDVTPTADTGHCHRLMATALHPSPSGGRG